MKHISIIGAGLAGLVSAILLNRKGFSVTLFEKKSFPFHRVCGEYISNETVPFLLNEGLFPANFSPPKIKKLVLSATNGKEAHLPLPLGGFGISRYVYDYFLYEIAKKEGVEILENTPVHDISFSEGVFTLKYGLDQTSQSPLVIGAYGKRSKIDKVLSRSFIEKRSPFIGVKYHVKGDFPADTIALHNFMGGYCGISKIEDEKYNVCYLARRDELKSIGNIPEMEKIVLHQNPHLKNIFENADFLFDKPEVINEISFEAKALIENHILMVGDAAGLITPLCGNGMAMAIHSAKILSDTIANHWVRAESFDRFALGYDYVHDWEKTFSRRLWVGRKSQNLFGTPFTSKLAVNILQYTPAVATSIIKRTHGVAF